MSYDDKASSISPESYSRVPRKKPDRSPEPPVGSASTSNTGRGQRSARPSAVVVTPGDPDAEVSAMTATTSPLPRIKDERNVAGGGTCGEHRGVGMRDQYVDD